MTETPDARECARKAHAKMEDLRQKVANLPTDRTPDMSEQAAPDEPKYTESDMRVLTEAALRLGRKEALEEAVAAVTNKLGITSRALPIIRSLFSQAAPDAASGRTDPGMDSDLPQDSRAVRSPQGDPNG